jgi:hypothetical protein
MPQYFVGRQFPGSHAGRQLSASTGTISVGVYAVGNIPVPRIEWTTLRQAMENQMHLIQNRAAENARTHLQRERASTGRLSRAVASPKNVKLYSSGGKPVGFAVGLTGYLDSDASEVKYYWRAIEEGSSRMVGRRIGGPKGLGTWGNGIPTPGQGGYTAYPPPVMAGPPYGVDLHGGKFLPLGWYDAANVTTAEAGVKPFVITRAIKAHRYYAKAWAEVNTPAKMERAFVAWARANGMSLKFTGAGAGASRVVGDLRIRD